MTLCADVVVAGGGISGLAAAYRAHRSGASVVLLDTGTNVGGVMQSDVINGFLVEHGPTSMAATQQSTTLLHELGIGDDIVLPPTSAARRYVVRDGLMQALPSSPGSLLRSDLLSAGGKMRLLAEPFITRRDYSADEESLGALVRRRFGQEVLDYFVDPFVSGVCAGDPEKLSSRHVLRMLAELEHDHGSVLVGAIKRGRQRKEKREGHIVALKRGMNQLPQAFRKMLDGACIPDATLLKVETTRDGFVLACRIGAGVESVMADSFVCALPSHILPSVEWPVDWHEHIMRMSQVKYAPVCTVALGFRREDVAHPLDGFGVLIPSIEKRGILGALFNSSMFPGRAPADSVLVTAFVGGARMFDTGRRATDGAPMLDAAMCERTAIQELTQLLGIRAAPTMTSVAHWDRGIPQLEVGHYQAMNAASAIEIAAPKVLFTGSYLSGAAIGDCLTHGARAGEHAAAGMVRSRSSQANNLAESAGALR